MQGGPPGHTTDFKDLAAGSASPWLSNAQLVTPSPKPWPSGCLSSVCKPGSCTFRRLESKQTCSLGAPVKHRPQMSCSMAGLSFDLLHPIYSVCVSSRASCFCGWPWSTRLAKLACSIMKTPNCVVLWFCKLPGHAHCIGWRPLRTGQPGGSALLACHPCSINIVGWCSMPTSARAPNSRRIRAADATGVWASVWMEAGRIDSCVYDK